MKHGLTLKPEFLTLANGAQTSDWCSIAREFVEPLKMRKQMTGKTGALIHFGNWAGINWIHARSEVRRLQVRIAKAVKENKWNKVRCLQHLLTHSFYAKALAVNRGGGLPLTSNKGKKTPGVDGVLWQGTGAKWQAAQSLRRRGYQPRPLRRIYIPKKNGKLRPLSIPTMKDRAMQALHKLALAPVAETTADRNSYGFRESRGCADAIAAGFNALSKPNSATWILEGDIKGCFDNIIHNWMLENIPMDKEVLRKWLRTGYIEEDKLYPSRKGTPQGGIISPTLMNMTLDGMEQAICSAVPRRSRLNFVRYADDFIITCKSQQLLEEKVKPTLEEFLKLRGLRLSEEKTLITHIKNGFTFLGQTFRKHGRTLHIMPSKEGVLALKRKISELIRTHVSMPMPSLIQKLNQTLRGWGNYHRHVVASHAFSQVDSFVYDRLWRMLRRRHPKKPKRWLYGRYWRKSGKYNKFSVVEKLKEKRCIYSVTPLREINIQRHIKIKADANPYEPKDACYFWYRRNRKGAKILPALSARQYRNRAA